MCGFICAVTGERPWDGAGVEAARDALRHRGPDAADTVLRAGGTVAMGHRRLSIVDLSEAGNQPMSLDHLTVVFNGEIYNYPDLRAQLEQRGCRFRSHCDTEVLLHGHAVWGEQLCEKLEGMFAFALWDDRRRELHLGRDHLGQKPLYWTILGDRFIAASEIKAILSLTGRVFPMRKQAPMEFLVYDYVPEPFTWYEGIQALPPGHRAVVRVEDGRPTWKESEYWTFRPDPDPRPIRREAALDLLGAQVESAVRAHLMADVEVGAFLSGGVDSGCTVTLAAPHLNYPIHTYAIGYPMPGQDELERARETAERARTVHHERVIGEDAFAAVMTRMLEIFDQPFGDISLVPTHEVARFAAERVKVVLTGDGGDEVFGGYWHMAAHMKFPPMDWSSWNGFKRSLHLRRRGLRWWQGCNNFGHSRVPPDEVRSWMTPDARREVEGFDGYWYYRKHWRLELDPFRRAQWLDLKAYLPSDVLVKVDRCTMRHSLEARPPFLSPRLVECMMNLPTDVKNPDGEFKGLFRSWLTGRIPDSVLQAPKLGFGLPPGLGESHILSDYRSHGLRRCMDRGLVTRAAAAALESKPFQLFRLSMIEHAFLSECFSNS